MRIEDGDFGSPDGIDARDGRIELELSPGESVRIGDRVCTVVEVEPGEVHLRVDPVLTAGAAAPLDRRAAVLAGLAR